MAPSSDVQAFRECLASSKNIIVLAGAGLSASSGLQTYRDENGLWLNNNQNELAYREAFVANPSRVWKFSHQRREDCMKSQPNAAHQALASLNDPAILERICPSLAEMYTPPLLITQNVDDLSLRALASINLPDSKARKRAEERLLEIHGNIFTTRCTSCKHVNKTYEFPLCPALAPTPASEASLSSSLAEQSIPASDLPRCGGINWKGSNRYGRCGGLLRPAVVWFGEIPDHLGEVSRQLNWCDLLLVVGTSSTVYPAAEFADVVSKREGKIAIFNLKASPTSDRADFAFLGPCEQTLPAALGI